VVAVRRFHVTLDYAAFARIIVSAGAMAPPALVFNRLLPPAAALVCDVAAGAVIYLVMLGVSGAVDAADAVRVEAIAKMLPFRLQYMIHFGLRRILRRAYAR
jgi:TRAP-type C4-dicarboxylate transport system permease small subunit